MSKEVMQQALEALEQMYQRAASAEAKEISTEELESISVNANASDDVRCEAQEVIFIRNTIAALRAALEAPQPAQEPVAYRYRFGDVWMFDTCRWNGQNPDEVVPVYTTPQAPQRQPLTDQEIDDLYINGTRHWIGKREVARAVEALITKGPAA